MLRHIAMAPVVRRQRWLVFAALWATFLAVPHLQAGSTAVIPSDSNSGLNIENAIASGSETRVLFQTWPDRGDPLSGNECPNNYYTLTLTPGLSAPEPELVAGRVCGSLYARAALLENGEVLAVAGSRLERWRDGEKISSTPFSTLDGVEKLGINGTNAGGQFFAFSPRGGLVAMVMSGDATQDRAEYRDFSSVLVSLKSDGSLRWEQRLGQDLAIPNEAQLWAGEDGGALLAGYHAGLAFASVEDWRLHAITADGTRREIHLTDMSGQPSAEEFTADNGANMAAVLAQVQQLDKESVKKVHAVPRPDGGFDVLFYRESEKAQRDGHYLYRLAANGTVEEEYALGRHIVAHGLKDWTDFYVFAGQLVLLGRVVATQNVVLPRGRRAKWSQNTVSWIDLADPLPDARLVPLDEQYLEATILAGDEGRQYLDNHPGSKPMLLTTVGGNPLVVSRGYLSRRQVVRLHEADRSLEPFTEVWDETQAEIAKQQAREQRKADRQTTQAQMKGAMAGQAGMSSEEFQALSKEEQLRAMIQGGDMSTMIATIAAQGQQGASPGQQAQMAAAMAQMQQMLGQQGKAMVPGQMSQAPAEDPPAQLEEEPVAVVKQAQRPEETVQVDDDGQARVRYSNPGGGVTRLIIMDDQSGQPMFYREYSSGEVNESIDMGQFGVSLERLRIKLTDGTGAVLKEMGVAGAQ